MQKAATEKLENSFSDHELKDGRVIKLDTPKYLYEADLLNGNKVGEIVITPEGQVTEGPEWIVRPL